MYAKAKEQFDAGNKEFLRVKALLKEARAEKDNVVQVSQPVISQSSVSRQSSVMRVHFLLHPCHTPLLLPYILPLPLPLLKEARAEKDNAVQVGCLRYRYRYPSCQYTTTKPSPLFLPLLGGGGSAPATLLRPLYR